MHRPGPIRRSQFRSRAGALRLSWEGAPEGSPASAGAPRRMARTALPWVQGRRDRPACADCPDLHHTRRRLWHLPRSCALVLLARSTVIRAAGNHQMGGGRKGVWGEPGTGAVIFRGRGRFRVPPSDFGLVFPPACCAECSWSDPDLTLGSPRGGGEVRITETERSERVSAGRRGCRATSGAYSARICGRAAVRGVCSV